MKLYDETIQKIKALLEKEESRSLPLGGAAWPQVSDRSMFLRSDLAYVGMLQGTINFIGEEV